MTQKFGIGIIGCGEISAAHGRAYTALSDYCQIVAMSDVVEAAARRRADEFGVETVYTDYRDLLADKRIDAVAICTPHYLHAPMSIAAAEAGKHILVEKPMCITIGESQEMIAAARRHGVKLTMPVEHVNPRHRFIKEHVLPEIGEISHSHLIDFYFRNTAYYEKARWRGSWRREGGGIFVNQAIYTWDTYQWLLGGVDTAYGYWANLLHPNIEVEDIGYGLIRFQNGTHGKLFATSNCEAPENTEWLRIQGSEGAVFSVKPWLYEIDFSLKDKAREKQLRAAMENHLISLDGPGLDTWDNGHDRRVLLQMYDIIQAVREDREVTVSPESCSQAIKMLNGIHWSGWHHAEAFKQWAWLGFDLPQPEGDHPLPTAAYAATQDWRGGKLVERLINIVRDPAPYLEAPFI